MLKTTITTQVFGDTRKLSEKLSQNVQCPECQHQFNQSVAGTKDDTVFVCPTCKNSFSVKSVGAVDVAKTLDSLDRAWENLIK